MLNLCLNCLPIFRGDIHVNGNGRDTYKFRAIHPNLSNSFIAQDFTFRLTSFSGSFFTRVMLTRTSNFRSKLWSDRSISYFRHAVLSKL